MLIVDYFDWRGIALTTPNCVFYSQIADSMTHYKSYATPQKPTSAQKENYFSLLGILKMAETAEEVENLRDASREQVEKGLITPEQRTDFYYACRKLEEKLKQEPKNENEPT